MTESFGRFRVLVLACFVLVACGPASLTAPPPAPPPPPESSIAAASEPVEVPPAEDGDLGPVPVTREDPWLGRGDAPVTIVEFGDFQCPFCARAAATITELRARYGDSSLRFVWKNNPLPFHADARPAAIVAMAVYERLGNKGFWDAYQAFYGDTQNLKGALSDVIARAGTTFGELRASASWARAEAKVDRDLELAKKLEVSGTPMFLINGVLVSGAQPIEKFVPVIDDQLAKAKALVARGTPPSRVYAELTKTELASKPPPAPPKPDEDPTTVWQVPIAGAPVRGKATALVTIVEVADFQCPFCGRAAPTLKALEGEYGDKLRFVFKHDPLPFHRRAVPAAELAIEARAQRGDKAFWAAHDLLYAKECVGSPGAPGRQECMDAGGTWMDHQMHLEDADLRGYAKTLGLDVKRVQAAIATNKHADVIEADQSFADDLSVLGTPQFFINGRSLKGAQPIEAFRAIIEEELLKAQALVRTGIAPAKVYDKLFASAKAPPSPERKTLPAPTSANPSRGPANAKVVIQIFADFQCPFCKRVLPTLDDLEKAFPGRLRFVWRNLPLPMHNRAAIAAEAAMEAFAQKGDLGFWAMHAKLFGGQDAPDGLERPALDAYAAAIGLDAARFANALDTSAHKDRIQADATLASSAGINGTPVFVINGYVVHGAESLTKFKKIVQRALAEAK